MVTTQQTKRLLNYRTALHHLKNIGFHRIYSYTLGNEVGVSADIVRKDLSTLNVSGKKRGGYDIGPLIERLEDYFSIHEDHEVILFGAGNIGRALMNYSGFRKNKIFIIAAFDNDPMKTKTGNDIPIYPMVEAERFINQHGINVAILAVPANAAQHVCNQVISYGINSIMNFAPVVLKVPKRVHVSNINLYDELMNVFFMGRTLKEPEL
ncbi:MAG: redox-sensing transcriptional repressor Rex [Bacteroidales bacterium]|nr:redox-sensing transcriptional repressor Rex [Bacteroidales bacterium]